MVHRHQAPIRRRRELELNPCLLSLFPEHKNQPSSVIAEGTQHLVRSVQQEVHLHNKAIESQISLSFVTV